jgi:chemotaxis protein methyltransferase CheR
MISPEDYAFLSDLLMRHSGLALGPGKEYLVESRLPPVIAMFGHASISTLVQSLRIAAPEKIVKSVCDAMTTGETLFFRDSAPFTTLQKQILPGAIERMRAARRPLRIWCAACSTGQEPFSIAMILAQVEQELKDVKVEIVATDFSSNAIARAKEGIYNHFEVQRGLPVQLLVKFFRPVPEGFQVIPDLHRRITFQEMNLLKPFPGSWQFDIIFCRNVLIYFDLATKRDVLERLAKSLSPGGTVFLGGTESTLGITDALTRVPGQASGLYCRPSELETASKAIRLAG